MPQQIEVPGMGIVEFPDFMSDADISSAIQKNMSPPQEAQPTQRSLGNRNVGLTTSLGDIEPGLQDAPQKAAVGLGRSFQNLGESAKQIGLGIGEKLGLVPEGRTQEYTRQADAERALYQSTPYGQSGIAKGAELIGDTLPYLAVPGGVAGGLIKRVGTGMLAGTGIGLAQYVPEGGSRIMNGVVGGLTAGALPVGLAAGGKLIDLGGNVAGKAVDFVRKHTGDQNAIAQEMLRGVDPQAAMKTKRAAERLGLNLTPAEASGSQIAAKQQGKLGVSEAGEEALQAFGKKRSTQERGIIEDFLDTVSSDKSIAAREIRDTAKQIQAGKENPILSEQRTKLNNFLNTISPERKNVDAPLRQTSKDIIDLQRKELQAKAEPLYRAAMPKKIAPNKLKSLARSDPNIGNAVDSVLNNPVYAHDLKGYAPNSIKVLDLAKKELDSQIARFNNPMSQNFDRYKAGLLTDSKARLLKATDGFSPTYAQARKIYGEGAKPLEALENSHIGKIANLDDTQLKSTSKIIFDPAQTNLNVLGNIRDNIMKQSPGTWRNMIRDHIESKLEAAGNEATGTLFNKKILGNQRDYQQLLEASKGMPDVQKQLAEMRPYFQASDALLSDLKKTGVARIANLDDTQLKNVGKVIFDPAETDPKVMRSIRDQITKSNPDAWRRVIRNEMERRLDIAKGSRNGSTFYNQVLGRDRDFKQFLVATKGMPDIQRKIIDMRRSFKDLINPESVKGTAGKSRSSLDVPRSTYEAVMNYANNVLGGKYDQGAIKLITSNQWDKEFKAIAKIQSKPIRTEKFGALLGKISALSATEPDIKEDN